MSGKVGDTITYAPEKPPAQCPACGSSRLAIILYGKETAANPPQQVREAVDAGHFVLDGSLFERASQSWECLACKHRGGAFHIVDGLQPPT